MTKKPSILTGAVVGGLFIAPLIAIYYLTAQLIGTAFPPFDVFDWVGRVLPGPLVTFGIDSIVSVINIFNLGETSSTAKMAEQILAVLGMFATGVLVAALFFAVMRGREGKAGWTTGATTGLLVGLPVLLIFFTINETATADPNVSGIWILLGFALWGIGISWAYDWLASQPAEAEKPTASVEGIDRRTFLVRIGGASAALTIVGAGLGSLLYTSRRTETIPVDFSGEAAEPWSASNALPNADAAVLPAPGTRPELTPLADHYRIDIRTQPVVINEAEWRLSIGGLVDTPVEMTLADIRDNYESISHFVTLACISNRVGGDLTGTTLWTGARLKDILADVGVQPSATHLKITSADGFDEVVALEELDNDDRIMLCYAWDGLPLAAKHGFPLRIWLPNRYGMKQPKWITNIDLIPSWEEGYWVRRGWDKDAVMLATSVVDTVAVNSLITEGDTTLVPLGGIAHAGDRGISKVEVRVDDGEWVEAQLRQPIGEATWVIWRYDWPFVEGQHTFSVRCVESDGTPQIESVRGSRPSGATGLDSVQANVG